MNESKSHADLSRSKRLGALDYLVVFACLLLIPSAVIRGILGLDERTAFALLVPVVIIASLIANRIKIQKVVLPVALLLALVGSLASILSGIFSQLLMGIALAIAVVVGRQLYTTLNKPRALRAMSWFSLLLLIGGIVGIAYSAVGGSPLMEVQVSYRTTYLYLTTFSFATIGSIIRPSGIFDEPGSFSMYVVLITMFNDALRQNQRINAAMVALLVFIGSLAGVVFAVLYVLTSNAARARRRMNLSVLSFFVIACTVLIIVFPSNPITSTVDTFYSDRFRVEDGRLSGDNRSIQVSEFFDIVDKEILVRGTAYDDQMNTAKDQTSNPFSIVYSYGLLISLPYFALLIWLVVMAVRQKFRNSYLSLGLVLLLLQRPYLFNMAWSIFILAAVWLVYETSRNARLGSGSLQ